jgi:hypothetical protein
MSERQAKMCEKLKKLGYGQDSEIKLYGDKYSVTSDPMVINDNVVVVDAVEQKSGRARRVKIPLNVISLADEKRIA